MRPWPFLPSRTPQQPWLECAGETRRPQRSHPAAVFPFKEWQEGRGGPLGGRRASAAPGPIRPGNSVFRGSGLAGSRAGQRGFPFKAGAARRRECEGV